MSIGGLGGRPRGVPKTGGRKKGTPNKATLAVAEKLAALGCDPISGMAEIAGDKNTPVELRLRSYIELAQSLYPKRKATDATDKDQPNIIVETTVKAPVDSSPKAGSEIKA